MKKIAIVTDAWHPQVNGVVTVIEHTKSLLEQRGYKVILIQPEIATKLPIFFYPEIQLSLFARPKVLKILKKEQPDFIHIATEGPLGLAARSICVDEHKNFTSSYHTHFPEYIQMRLHTLYGTAYRYIRWFHRPATKTMVATESLGQDLAKHGFDHLALWPLGIDTELFTRSKNPTTPKSLDKPVFVYFGRIAVEKSVEDFLKLDLPGSKLVVGDGPQRAELQKKYGHNALFVGYKKGQELVDIISGCDVFVFPSRTETFGLVILEAMSCGLPVAGYNEMGPRDLITNGVDGYFGDDLRQNAINCLKLSSEKCREKALQYTWDKSVDAFLSNLVPV